MLIVSSVVSVVASIIAIACCAVSYVSSSSVTNLQRETDALRNRVDVAEDEEAAMHIIFEEDLEGQGDEDLDEGDEDD